MKNKIIQFPQKPNLKDSVEEFKNEVNKLTILRNEMFEYIKNRILNMPNLTKYQIKDMLLFYKFNNVLLN